MKVCIRCHSPEVVYAGETAGGAAFGTGNMYYCKECRRLSPGIIELSKESFEKLNREGKDSH